MQSLNETPCGTRKNRASEKCQRPLMLLGEPGWDRTIDHLIKSLFEAVSACLWPASRFLGFCGYGAENTGHYVDCPRHAVT